MPALPRLRRLLHRHFAHSPGGHRRDAPGRRRVVAQALSARANDRIQILLSRAALGVRDNLSQTGVVEREIDMGRATAKNETDVVVVGGGIAGLAAALYLSRGGLRVAVYEKSGHPGGRARTRAIGGFRF